MREDAFSQKAYTAQLRRRRIWKRIVGVLACVVVFVTTYALILPAITMEPEPVCGLQEHIHDESCYTLEPPVFEAQLSCLTASMLHQHTEDCYDAEGNLICGQADFVIHYHDVSCYDSAGNLVCPLPEIGEHVHSTACFADGGHVHTEACYELQNTLICGQEETAGHSHGADCYDEAGNFICTLAESDGHIHDETCYEASNALICGESENDTDEQEPVCGLLEVIPHIHEPGCYDAEGRLICGQLEIRVHQHDANCMTQVEVLPERTVLTCSLTEHTHSENCYPQHAEEPEDETPTEPEYPVYCGMEAHEHTDECCRDGSIVCGLEAHVHTEACWEPPVEDEADLTADLETSADWEATMADVVLTGEYRTDILAIAESQLGYTASVKNYIVDETGREKRLSRYGQWYGDAYGDWCAMFVSFCLHYGDVEEMPLKANCQRWMTALSQPDCDLLRAGGPWADADWEPEADPENPEQTLPAYTPLPGDLVFFDYENDGVSDHVGLVYAMTEATDTTPAQLITIERAPGDQVGYRTYSLPYSAIAGFGTLPEQTFYCGKTGHVHTVSCGGAAQCALEEHVHTEDCEKQPEELLEEGKLTQLQAAGEDYIVSVLYGPDAALPEGVTLSVREILPGTEEYQTYYNQSQAALATEQQEVETLTFARFFDIQFLLDGEVVEPAAPVHVTITYASGVETEAATGCWAIHFAETGTELLDAEASAPEEGGTSFSHTQEGFSVVGNLVTAAYGVNLTDIGPDVLPVDYYVHIDGQWVCVGSTKTGWYGDYTATDWKNDNRDCITVAQANSILEPYGFDTTASNAALQITYQRKETYLEGNLHCDTKSYSDSSKSASDLIPLARNENPKSGYNLYFLPGNTNNSLSSKLETIPTGGSDFYTVSIYNAAGTLLEKSDPILTGGGFRWQVTGSDAATWLAAYSDGRTEKVFVTEGTLRLTNITSTVTLSPAKGGEGSHSVTFKVLVDGQWKTVGSLPYYYTSSNGYACITSDMAAQFFGSYGYNAAENPAGHFAYSYNDIYIIYYAGDTGYCMDVSGGTIQKSQPVQLWTANNSDAQTFRIWDSGEGYHYITPIANSSYHVNVLGGGTADGTKLGIHTATDAASHWKVVTNSDGTTCFYNKNAPNSACIDLDGGTVVNGSQLQIWSNGAARYWKLAQQFRVSSSTNTQNPDGSWSIGSALETNGDIVCYYLPVAATEAFTDLPEAEAAQQSSGSWYSVTVVDDTHAVYSDVELQAMAQNVLSGTGVTVTVRNADGILWSCRGLGDAALEVETTQAEGETTFVIKAVNQPVEIVATQANPDFTVQYYCNIPRFVKADSGDLAVIDTSGGALPKNGTQPKTTYLLLEGTGTTTGQNAGDRTELYRVKTVIELTKLYSDEIFQYETSPGLDYFNKLKNNESYALKEIWVLKDGKKSTSLDPEDWEIYSYQSDTTFTNEASQATDKTILIREGAVIRLVSDTSTGNYLNSTTFYDYNIAGTHYADGSWDTTACGINSSGNYSGNGAKFAFGNQNCGTNLSGEAFNGNTLNKSNASGFKGCTFELATRLDDNGNIAYNSNISVPNLFNDGDASGKQTYAGSSLTFERVGDTYTLSQATLANSNGQSNTIGELQYFFHPSPAPGQIWDGVNSGLSFQSNIFTNNFWPMDYAFSKSDDLWGQKGNTGYFNGVATNHDFPTGDDGRAHNWFFGMNFAISFSLTADYEGPLEYYFFGDDDLWVFLDGRLVCDIGGVHSSVGEYVNLWDYLEHGSSGQHTLSFFYTERGASGSTCYMSFTLPSVSSATTSRDTGSLQIAKSLEGIGDADFSGVEYQFQVELLTSENGSPLSQTFSYARTDGTDTYYGTIKSGGTITLHQNESATISGIPAGTFYRVTELTTVGYHTTVNGKEGYIVSGTIENGGTKPANFVNAIYHELPESGGPGTYLYTCGGAALLLAAAALMYCKLRRRKEARPPD